MVNDKHMKKIILTICILTSLGLSAKKNTTMLFSVAPERQVEFSKGNLQYQATTNTFRFAKHQYDIIGDANENIGPDYEGWIDLFAWASSGYDNRANDPNVIYVHPWSWRCRQEHSANPFNPYGYGPSTTMPEASLVGTSREYDWGVHNPIKNGGNRKDMWRTLTRDEWQYLLTGRPNAKQLQLMYDVKGVHGLLLLPDNFQGDVSQMSFKQLEKQGAVFLPGGGMRFHLVVVDAGNQGSYWSSTAATIGSAYFLGVYPGYASLSTELYGRHPGRCVRLVRDVK